MEHPLLGTTEGQGVLTFVEVGCSPVKAILQKSSRGVAQTDRTCTWNISASERTLFMTSDGLSSNNSRG